MSLRKWPDFGESLSTMSRPRPRETSFACSSSRRAWLASVISRFIFIALLGCPIYLGAAVYDDVLHAIEIDDHRTVAELLKRGVDPNTVNARGESLLTLAARSGKPAVVKTLL